MSRVPYTPAGPGLNSSNNPQDSMITSVKQKQKKTAYPSTPANPGSPQASHIYAIDGQTTPHHHNGQQQHSSSQTNQQHLNQQQQQHTGYSSPSSQNIQQQNQIMIQQRYQQALQQQQRPQPAGAPPSPHLFSPRQNNPLLYQQQQQQQYLNQMNPRYRGPVKVDTILEDQQIPNLDAFGEPVDPSLPLPGIRPEVQQTVPSQQRIIHQYMPPCIRNIHSILEHLRRLFRLAPDSQEYHQQREHVQALFAEFPEDIDPFILIRDLPALPSALRKSPIPPKRPDAPKITLALDLDETLAHCSLTPIDNASCTFHVDFQGNDFTVYGLIRPHLEYFLRQVSQWYEIVIFTASQKSYADSLLNIIDPMNQYITHRVFRDSCVHVENAFLKDLTILGRPLEHLIILDNSVQAFGYQLSNGIPCESWFNEENDVELLNLVPLLRHLKDVDDVRPYIKDLFCLQEFVDSLSRL